MLKQLNLKPSIEKLLERKQWTLKKLATADPAELTRYKGIGKKTAQDIVKKAQDLVNRAGLQESQELKTKPLVMNEADEPQYLSVRQRRILAAYEQRKKEGLE